jgi:Protein of unknown function (DUF1501)
MNALSSFFKDQTLSRRLFAERLAKTAFGVTLLPHLNAAESGAKTLPGFGKAKNVIWLQMLGGMSHIDTLDPKTGATQGPLEPIQTKAGFQLGGYLPTLAKEHASRLCLIRSMTSKTGVHASGQYLMRTGYEQRGTVRHPTIGAWAQELLGRPSETLPASVCINRGADHGNGFFSAAYSPLPIHSPDAGLQYAKHTVSTEVMDQRLKMLNQLDDKFRRRFDDGNLKAYTDFYEDTLKLLSSKDLLAFDIKKEAEPLREAYGKNAFGQGCLLARRLVENGIRFIEVSYGNWDMHNDLEDGMEDYGSTLDRALSTLLTDLQQRGLLETTMVVLCSEFGRTPEFNGRGGRDHHPKVFSTLLAGGPVKGGYVHGSSDAQGYAPVTEPVTIQDFHSTVGHALGLEVDRIVMSPSQRPFTVGDKGKVVSQVFA